MKMGEEWSARAVEYEESAGAEYASEAGLIQWLPFHSTLLEIARERAGDYL